MLLDEVTEDDDAGLSMAAALVASCTPAVTRRAVAQGDGGVLTAGGEPVVWGELLVAGGGSFRQQAVRWLEQNGAAQVSDTSDAVNAIYSLRDGGVVSSVPAATLGPTLDRVVVQVVRAPSGSVVLSAQGYHAPGTLAAARYFVQTLLPARATLTTRWYVLEWEDLDASGGPTAGDRYTVIASGS
ncbi:MAG: hypothetical protein Q8N23_03080 [Archangium sp.]|nr:hypothetical protein [Archangium sp.]MDP3151626.1 hypothetical protein [Archangium sp.]MDP3569161.1 hypothetical protein [Archangium sp.]